MFPVEVGGGSDPVALREEFGTDLLFAGGVCKHKLAEGPRAIEAELERIMAPYASAREVVWCQEEPMNQGAWYASQHHMRRVIMKHNESIYLADAGRPAFAAPASGHAHLHGVRQQRLVEEALFG